MSDMRLVVVGAAGRMGRTLVRVIAESRGVTLAGAIERAGAPEIGKDSGELAGLGANGIAITTDPLPVFAKAEGVLDFTDAGGDPRFRRARRAGAHRPCHRHDRALRRRRGEDQGGARHAAIVKSGNMSVGVNLLAVLVRQAAKALADDFDIEVSGDASPRQGRCALGHGASPWPGGGRRPRHRSRAATRYVRAAAIPERARRGDIGFATLRGGSVIGEHSVIFAGDGETIEITHKASDRALFARGAVSAALWGRDKKPGLYSMADVLGLRRIDDMDRLLVLVRHGQSEWNLKNFSPAGVTST